MTPISGFIAKEGLKVFTAKDSTSATAPNYEKFHVADKEKKKITTNNGTQIEFKGTPSGAWVKYSLGDSIFSYEINDKRTADQVDNVTFWRDEEEVK